MRDAVHEKLIYNERVGLLTSDFRHLQQAQIHTLLGDMLLAFRAQFFCGLVRYERGDLGAKDAEHGVINLLLPPGEFAAYGNRARQIAHVIAKSGGDIQQEQVALFANLVVLSRRNR
jgi:hypothetical protein